MSLICLAPLQHSQQYAWSISWRAAFGITGDMWSVSFIENHLEDPSTRWIQHEKGIQYVVFMNSILIEAIADTYCDRAKRRETRRICRSHRNIWSRSTCFRRWECSWPPYDISRTCLGNTWEEGYSESLLLPWVAVRIMVGCVTDSHFVLGSQFFQLYHSMKVCCIVTLLKAPSTQPISIPLLSALLTECSPSLHQTQ